MSGLDEKGELLPCPFCGGEAEQKSPAQPHGGMVNCRSCGAEAFGPKWNRRAPWRTEAWDALHKWVWEQRHALFTVDPDFMPKHVTLKAVHDKMRELATTPAEPRT